MKGMRVDIRVNKNEGLLETRLQRIRGNITQGFNVSSTDGTDCTGHRSRVVAAF
jgi:hypothetical protein